MKNLRDIVPHSLTEGMIKYDNSKPDEAISHFTIHHKDGRQVGKAKTKNGARKAMDTHDNKHGSYVHHAVAHYSA